MPTGLFNLKQVNQAISQGAWSGYIAPKWVEYLCVAGGGGGGSNTSTQWGAGGGGAGGLLTGIVTVAAGTSYSVAVGAGGSGAASSGAYGTQGVTSSFGSIASSGGGVGGSRNTGFQAGGNGGSGGGVGNGSTGNVAGTGTSGQGNAGAIISGAGESSGGGGGGAGTVGLVGTSSTGIGGNGGAGIASSISGTVVAYAGGGGAAGSGTAGSGGVGGGGTGGVGGSAGTAGGGNTGGGGGGGNTGAAGGSGIVVVRYPGNVQFYTGGTVTYSNGYIVHNFTANGTLAPTTPTVVSEYQISRSLRFNSADSTYLNRTPATTTNRTTWTWSGWVKRASFGSSQVLFGAGPDASNYTIFYFSGTVSEDLEIYNYTGGVATGYAYTTSVFRDPSAWYHVVLAVDTNQATSADRTKIYVNGVLQPITISTTFASSVNTWVNTNNSHRLGSTPTTSAFYGGYMTEVNFIDGQALTPTSFGYVNPTTGIWSPAKYVGGYGTNGFYVNFSDNSNTTAATLGADYSGNGNNWTPNNFSVTAGVGNDSLVDSPTSYGTDTGVGGSVRGNYCTLNPLIYRYGYPTITTFSNGNLDALMTSAAVGSYIFGSIFVSSGKWYWETTINAIGNVGGGTGIDNGNKAYDLSTGSYYYYSNGSKASSGSLIAYGASYTTGDIIGTAYDADAGTLTFYKNGTSQGVAFTGITGQNGYLGIGENGFSISTNFGQRAFAYTAPSGFKALCTQNLPTPTIGATSATLAGKFFAPVLYTGNGATQSITVGFQPDFVWYKSRSSGTWNHGLFDSVRGTTKQLFSNSTAAEATYSGVTAFNSGGFSVGSDNGGNESGGSMVAWNWRASNATAVTNTSGSITSTVSANTTSGFSVVTYTGTGANATIGHGLGAVPSMIIVKCRNAAGDIWDVYHVSIGNTQYLRLNGPNPAGTYNSWQNTTPTSTVFYISTDTVVNTNGNTYVAYCFAPIAGYSAFGSYTGNASTDGTFVFTGFRPAYVMIKSSSASTDWIVYDAVRNTYNVTDLNLRANTTDAESSQAANYIDLLSNGFKLRGDGSGSTNASGATYIYMAFATSPFKYSLAR